MNNLPEIDRGMPATNSRGERTPALLLGYLLLNLTIKELSTGRLVSIMSGQSQNNNRAHGAPGQQKR